MHPNIITFSYETRLNVETFINKLEAIKSTGKSQEISFEGSLIEPSHLTNGILAHL